MFLFHYFRFYNNWKTLIHVTTKATRFHEVITLYNYKIADGQFKEMYICDIQMLIINLYYEEHQNYTGTLLDLI